MKALSRMIVLVLFLVPMSLAAQPTHGGSGKKGKFGNKKKGKNWSQSETYGKKHQEGNVFGMSGKNKWKKGKKKGMARGGFGIVGHGKRHRAKRRFQRLVMRIQSEWFLEDRLYVLSRAAADRFFTIRQAKILLRQFHGNKARLRALRVMRHSVVNWDERHRLLRSFEGRRAKKKAARILAHF